MTVATVAKSGFAAAESWQDTACAQGTPTQAETVAWTSCEQKSYRIQITVSHHFLKIGFILTCKVTSSCILHILEHN